MTAKKEETKKNMKELETKQEMKAKGKDSGIEAKLTFQYNGKTHTKGEKVLGLGENDLKALKKSGLI